MSAQPSLTLQRYLKASPSKVFSAWTEPAQIMKWMHPYDNEVVHAEMDLKVGGRFRIVMRAPGGDASEVHEVHEASGEFREVARDEKLVYTWAFNATPERESLVTLTLKADGDGTWLTLKHEQFADDAARDSHRGGWTDAIDGLERYFL